MAEYKKERGNYGEIKEREGVTVNMKRLAGVGSLACGDQRVEAVEAGAGRPMCGGRGGWRRKNDVWRHGAMREEEGLRAELFERQKIFERKS